MKLNNGNMKLLFCIGTRPEIIKIYSTYKEAVRRGHKVKVFYTNQNYADCLSNLIFEGFNYDKKHIITSKAGNLDGLLKELDNTMMGFKPDYVLVQGDTWSSLYGAIKAKALGFKLAHIEAGLRSYDLKMVEERVRTIVDNIADVLFVPTSSAYVYLRGLGLSGEILDVGNTIFDLLKGQKKHKPKGYILVTLHRPELVDSQNKLENVLFGISKISNHLKIPARFYIHPRTRDKINNFGIRFEHIALEEPVDHSDFIELLKGANLLITDSGGLQEEAAILLVPCITVRENTERPETVLARLNKLTGYNPNCIFECAIDILDIFKKGLYKPNNLYGEGMTGKLIIDSLEDKC